MHTAIWNPPMHVSDVSTLKSGKDLLAGSIASYQELEVSLATIVTTSTINWKHFPGEINNHAK